MVKACVYKVDAIAWMKVSTGDQHQIQRQAPASGARGAWRDPTQIMWDVALSPNGRAGQAYVGHKALSHLYKEDMACLPP